MYFLIYFIQIEQNKEETQENDNSIDYDMKMVVPETYSTSLTDEPQTKTHIRKTKNMYL